MTTHFDRLLLTDRTRLARALTLATSDGLSEAPADLGPALVALPPQRRLAVILHYALDLPISEVATLLAIPRATTRVHLHRARRTLHRADATLRTEIKSLFADRR